MTNDPMRPTRTLALAALLAVAPHAAAPHAAAQPTAAAVAIDFSHAGYGGGGVPIPDVPAAVTVRPGAGDDGARLQAALDRVARLPRRADGFRGAVLLAPGTYEIAAQLRLRADGVVLRGSGRDRTTLVATGTGRRTLLVLGGADAPSLDSAARVVDETVPAGALALRVEGAARFRLGDRVVVRRPSTGAWIRALGMDTLRGSFANQRLHWTPGSRDLAWERIVVAIDAARGALTLDAPITTALEARYGGGTVARVAAGGPVRGVGVERLTLVSAADTAANPRDEEHAWIAVALDGVEDAWVRDATARGFVGSAVRVGPRGRRVTVHGVRAERPVSELAGYRRQSFLVEGQQVLVHGCSAEQGLNDFAVGLLAAGPNAFVDDTARAALGASGSFESWASGVLYERVRVEGAALRLARDLARAQGGGWTAANAVAWDSWADTVVTHGPPDAPNVQVRSGAPLYSAQLARRRHDPLVAARALPAARPAPADDARPAPPLAIVNGRFVVGGRALWGGTVHEGWWRGQANPATALDHGVSATRWVPGRDGPGLTEDLPALAARMAADGTPFYNMVPGLWYDRRRDDHTVAARADGDAWAPFYELPWARSGRGTAWDGLSRFDLARFNPWYFARARELAGLAARRGLVVYHNLYNTHNLLEIGPHWADYPWRRANNVNDVGPAEPPGEPYAAPPERVHVANEVYDTADPRAAALHRALIEHTLDALGARPNVVLGVGFQFAGPLAFQRFFLDVVDAWTRRTGQRARVALTTSKDVTDSILADPARARHVAVIDTRYWQYRPDGSLWAPRGGRNLAFREMIAADFGAGGDTPPETTPLQAYRQVREYRDRYPDRAVVAWQNGVGPVPALMAGAAQVLMRNPAGGHNQARVADRTPLDAIVRRHLATRLQHMTPRDGWLADSARTWALADARGGAVLVYSVDGPSIALARALPRPAYRGTWLDPRTGDARPLDAPSPRPGVAIAKPSAEDWLLLLEAR